MIGGNWGSAMRIYYRRLLGFAFIALISQGMVCAVEYANSKAVTVSTPNQARLEGRPGEARTSSIRSSEFKPKFGADLKSQESQEGDSLLKGGLSPGKKLKGLTLEYKNTMRAAAVAATFLASLHLGNKFRAAVSDIIKEWGQESSSVGRKFREDTEERAKQLVSELPKLIVYGVPTGLVSLLKLVRASPESLKQVADAHTSGSHYSSFGYQ